jgi:hypothetical protein
MLYSRFIKFANSIYKSSKPAVKFLFSLAASDVRSVTGSNLRSILVTTGVQVIPGVSKAGQVKKYKLFVVPEEEKWKIPLLHSLLSVRAGEFEIPFDETDLEENEPNIVDDILDNICTS